ncbi:LysE family translocator [Neptuniibacter sp. QD48_11]|uniref:LysE family translocator n=1 Tax=Neptuniibacter sp. QD48_11 TaxID=3398211 RepID=UPI0039F48961
MVEILLYAFGVMYTPGPCNLLSLNAGIHGQIRSALAFSLGVGSAMLVLFLLFGYVGAWFITAGYELFLSAAGSLYILYLAYKVALSAMAATEVKANQNPMSFKEGLILQLLNPKAFIAILPIVSVQFPAAEISGYAIFVWSLLLSTMAFGAPSSYLLMGARLGKLIHNPRYFRCLNWAMSLLLVYVALDIAYQHIFLKLA